MDTWKKVADGAPPENAPVLLLVNGTIYDGMLKVDHPGFEDNYLPFPYFIDADQNCDDWEWDEVTHWMPRPSDPE